MRSDNRPQIGAKINYIREYEATMQPASSPEAPYSLLYRESMGSTMPNPMRSMKTVRKITSTDAFLFIRVKWENLASHCPA